MPAGNGSIKFGKTYVQQLQERIEKRWPVPEEQRCALDIMKWRAVRNSDEQYLRPTNWSEGHHGRRDYIIDPLGERIPYVWADLLFGEDPVIAAAVKKDADKMDDMVNANDLSSELHRGEWLCSSEGEVWYRIHPDSVKQQAALEFHSRAVVTPLWIGRDVGAAAFVSDLATEGKTVWRYVEIHTYGYVRRLLYKGTEKGKGVGTEVPLTSRPETARWERDWTHDLPMLAGRIVNKLGANRHHGVSDYAGVYPLLLTLNEITTIGQENARLTAKQRAIIPQRFLTMFGNLPRSAEILVATDVDQDPDKIKNDVAMIEFEFDAAALIAYTDHITDRVLTRARVAPQLVGRHTEGAQTGPALKARVIDSELAAQGKGKFWDDEMPRVLNNMAQVEKAEFSIGWSFGKKKALPSFKRANALPEDPEARSRRLAVAVNAGFLSRRSAVQADHPEWDDARVDTEMDQIEDDEKSAAPDPARVRGGNSTDNQPPGGTPDDRQQAPSPATGSGRAERKNGNVRAR